MQRYEIEAWVYRIAERIKAKQPIEDSHVELKREWPDPNDAARRIAGITNASHGSPTLLVVGIDEKAFQITGADYNNLATWWPQVQSEFESRWAPQMTDANVVIDGLTVVALVFNSERRPFLVKNAEFGKSPNKVEFEVPWREASRVRTAKRQDLIMILSSAADLPRITVLDKPLFKSDFREEVDRATNQPRPVYMFEFILL